MRKEREGKGEREGGEGREDRREGENQNIKGCRYTKNRINNNTY